MCIRDRLKGRDDIPRFLLGADLLIHPAYNENTGTVLLEACLLYTSDAADERSSVDLGGRRIIKKKTR